jgi:putative ABC transport system permease protein
VITYVKVALRNLRREKLYAALNIAGLALGIACCLILGLYLWGELTYDRSNINHERIYRIAQRFTLPGGGELNLALSSRVLGPMLAEEYPNVFQKYVRFTRFRGPLSRTLLRSDDRAYYWDETYTVDDDVFDVFTHKIIYGDPHTALTEPGSIAISRTLAERYFKNENPIGRTLYNAIAAPFKVTLVFEDLPRNSHLKYDALFSYKGIFQLPDDVNARRQMLSATDTYTYVLLPKGYDARNYAAVSQEFFEKDVAAIAKEANTKWESWLQPLVDIHLQSDLQGDRPTGNRLYLYAFAAVGLFILAVACINYVNLATARAARRARAIGLRKILGVDRGSLIAQLLGESVLFAMLATIIGVMAVEVLVTLPPITALFGEPLQIDVFGEPMLAVSIVGFGLLVGLAAGLYPSLYLSSFMPLSALAGRYQPGGAGLRLRESLVFLQFAISVGVIAATLLMTAQMRYIAHKALGFDAENRIVVPLRGVDLIEQQRSIATQLEHSPGVLGVTTSETIMGKDAPRSTRTQVETNEGGTREFEYDDIGDVGPDFLSVMGMQIVAGRDFSESMGTDVGQAIIVNETFVRGMGWDTAIGKHIGKPGSPRSGEVIGVVKDFHFRSLHDRISPLIIFRGDGDYSQVNPAARAFAERLMIIKVAQEGLRDTLRYIERQFVAFDPNRPFELSFLDANLDRLYASEERLMAMIGTFASICIFVACLGLFGLSAFTTEQRRKEIGIRKILGASVAGIILLLSRRVLLLISAGGVLGCAIAWGIMAKWLSGFAYRAAINPAYFVLAVFGAATVALATIALQSWRTARADPAGALQYE